VAQQIAGYDNVRTGLEFLTGHGSGADPSSNNQRYLDLRPHAANHLVRHRLLCPAARLEVYGGHTHILSRQRMCRRDCRFAAWQRTRIAHEFHRSHRAGLDQHIGRRDNLEPEFLDTRRSLDVLTDKVHRIASRYERQKENRIGVRAQLSRIAREENSGNGDGRADAPYEFTESIGTHQAAAYQQGMCSGLLGLARDPPPFIGPKIVRIEQHPIAAVP